MDRNSIVGFLLIGLVLMLWLWLNAPPPNQQHPASADTSASRAPIRDSLNAKHPVQAEHREVQDTMGAFFRPLASGVDRAVTVESERYHAELSTKGGNITSWMLKDYKTWDGHPVDLINREQGSDLNLLFLSAEGKIINTKNLFFTTASFPVAARSLNGEDSLKISFELRLSNEKKIVKTYTFYNNRSSFDIGFSFVGMQDVISNFEYQLVWENGLRYQERNSIDESNFAVASASAGGEIKEADARNLNEPVKENISGRVSWVATRNKYFAVAIIPREKESQGATLEGHRLSRPDNGAVEEYALSLRMPFYGKSLETDRFSVFLGPMIFDEVKSYNLGLEQIMSLGAAWVIRPISEYVIIPVFKLFHFIVPNYGIVLILFSIFIKAILYPLSKTSMKSMQRMQALQPMMTEIREKNKDDPQKLNQQTMRLYKEYGVNPAGGCLPMILQLPILYALWAVFRSTIDLRQASFAFWIHDLSIPDVITALPFHIPFFNITEISGLAALMGITIFIQQKMTVKDPRQKMMVWMMPVMMTLLFNSFPSGLNLYYFVFNLLSIGQQLWFNKQHMNDPLRKVDPEKSGGGFISRLTKNLPNLKR